MAEKALRLAVYPSYKVKNHGVKGETGKRGKGKKIEAVLSISPLTRFPFYPFYLTMTVTSFDPQGEVKFTVYLPVRLLIEVMRNGNVPYSLSD
jgi:hypothetical protein